MCPNTMLDPPPLVPLIDSIFHRVHSGNQLVGLKWPNLQGLGMILGTLGPNNHLRQTANRRIKTFPISH